MDEILYTVQLNVETELTATDLLSSERDIGLHSLRELYDLIQRYIQAGFVYQTATKIVNGWSVHLLRGCIDLRIAAAW